MDIQDVLGKLSQIDEHARLTLDEFPKNLTKERLRMIIALVGYLKTEIALDELQSAELRKVA